ARQLPRAERAAVLGLARTGDRERAREGAEVLELRAGGRSVVDEERDAGRLQARGEALVAERRRPRLVDAREALAEALAVTAHVHVEVGVARGPQRDLVQAALLAH